MSRKYRHIIRAWLSEVWALDADVIDQIEEMLELRATGREFTSAEVQERIGGKRGEPKRIQVIGSKAVVPVSGVLSPRANMFTQISGGTSYETLANDLITLDADKSIVEIVLDVGSPGGSAHGAQEFAAVMRDIETKITAVAHYQMLSGAYWVAAGADEIVASPSSQIGSIGVIGEAIDRTSMNKKIGYKVNVIRAGRLKGVPHPDETLTDEGRKQLQTRVDGYYDAFISDIARGRGVSEDTARKRFGEGAIFNAQAALAAGMVDRIGTLESVITTTPPAGTTNAERAIMKPTKTRLVAMGLIKATASDVEVSRAVNELAAQYNAAAPETDEAAGELLDLVEAARTANAAISAGSDPVTTSAAEVTAAVAQSAAVVDASAAAVAAAAEVSAAAVAAAAAEGSEADATAAADAGAAERERERCAAIMAQAGCLPQITVADVREMISRGSTTTQAADIMRRLVTDRSAAVSTVGATVIREGFREYSLDAQALISQRTNSADAADLERVQNMTPSMQAASCLDLVRGGLEAHGMRASHLSPDQLAAIGIGAYEPAGFAINAMHPSYLTSGNFPELLSVSANKFWIGVSEYSPATYRRWAWGLPGGVSDFKENMLHALGEYAELDLVPDDDEYQQVSINEEAPKIQVRQYGNTTQLTRRMMIDDNLGAFEEHLRDFLLAADLTLNRLCLFPIVGNTTISTGGPLFTADSATYHDVNDITSGGVPSTTEVSKVRKTMRVQKGPNGRRNIGGTPSVILVPAELESDAEKAVSGRFQNVPDTEGNLSIFRGRVEPIADPMLDEYSTQIWYGLGAAQIHRTIVYATLRGQTSPQITNWLDPNRASRSYKVAWDIAAVARSRRGVVRNAGA